MSFAQIGNPDPKYLAATDILIGDMSDINFEFLVYDRPVILLANEWLIKNFPDIGIKTDLNSLKNAIERSIKKPKEFSKRRKYWLKKTMLNPDGNSSVRVLDVILRYSKIKYPFIVLLHGNNEVLKTHLNDLHTVILERGINVEYIDYFNFEKYSGMDNVICISPFIMLMKGLNNYFTVHIDHGVKGPGTTDLKSLINQFKEREYFPFVKLHITEGEASQKKTKLILGPYKDRAVMVGYPKSDSLIKLNTRENKVSVCNEFGFNPDKLLITYAPAGKYSYPWKQGASLSIEVLKRLKKISREIDVNILVKLKSEKKPLYKRIYQKIKRTFFCYINHNGK